MIKLSNVKIVKGAGLKLEVSCNVSVCREGNDPRDWTTEQLMDAITPDLGDSFRIASAVSDCEVHWTGPICAEGEQIAQNTTLGLEIVLTHNPAKNQVLHSIAMLNEEVLSLFRLLDKEVLFKGDKQKEQLMVILLGFANTLDLFVESIER